MKNSYQIHTIICLHLCQKLCNFEKENKVTISTSFEVFLILFMASYDVKIFFFYLLEFSTQITLVESRAFSKFEAVELKNQGVLVELVSQT